jgi:Patatin-like phospholipase
MTTKLSKFHDVLIREHRAINQRRGRLGRDPIGGMPPDEAPEDVRKAYAASRVHETIGLAFSGGGIRSAAICLGAVQALADKEIIPRIDYLSTVSGGGYTGTAITSCMSATGEFPFLNPDDRSDSPALKHIRNYSNFLIPRGLPDVLVNFSIYLRGLFANLLFVLPVLLLLAAVTIWANPTIPELFEPGFHDFPGLRSFIISSSAFGVTITFALLVAIYYFIWALARSFTEAKSDLKSLLCGIGYGSLIVLAVFAFFELQPFIVGKIFLFNGYGTGKSVAFTSDFWIKAMTATLAPALTVVSFFSKYLGDILKRPEGVGSGWTVIMSKIVSLLIVWLAALALPLLLWLVYLLLVFWGVAPNEFASSAMGPPWLKSVVSWLDTRRLPGLPEFASAYAIMAAPMLLFLLLLKPNANSLHRLYRDRLSNAFVFAMHGEEAANQDSLKLSQIQTANGPYPLYNTALNVQGSQKVNQRGRNADFFLLSPCYCGSEVTDYVETSDLEKVEPSLNVGTAMAVSGAAISSNMGSETIKPLAATLALLNFRLGYWIRNPQSVGDSKFVPESLYLVKEVVSRLDEKSAEIYLTDGGHIENLGIYELLRRRCRLIIVVDGEADQEMNFSGFIKLQRYARIDLGIRIEMKWDKVRYASLEAQKGKAASEKGPHCAIGKIEYSETESGALVYIKSSVTGDENDYITDYNRRFKAFPHETTGDQFFSEEQFEVYRALGFHMAKGLLNGDHQVQTLDEELQRLTKKPKGHGVDIAVRLLGVSKS